ncbi:MAG TPA: DUF5916 domain-containing protein, partial [Acidobacteriota bacterium]|nr:DUF5916 domain-containing protein [Acidobacteriota bacterium]
SSTVFGIDGWTFLDGNKTWVLTGYTGLSHIKGNEFRITDVQQNSQHYFQRPDADYVEVDPDATSLTGYVGRFYVNKEKGNVFMNSAFGFVSPKFDNNDLGFLWRADQINTHTAVGYKWTTPGKFYRYAEAAVAGFRSWDYDWNTVWSGMYHYGYVEFPNYYTLDYSIAWNPENTFNNTRTRGGPQTLNLHGFETNLFVRTDRKKKWVFGGGENSYESGNSSSRSVNAEVEWKPVANVSLKFTPQFERFSTPAFWINNYDDPLATHTFQKRYVFGELHQDTFSASFRVNWTFTPRLSLQFYGQPLISAGDYSEFKELAAARTYDFNIFPQEFISLSNGTYTIDPDGAGPANSFSFANPDFNFKSLRGNAVLRWEYRPGATVFFVWTQTRSDYENLGEFQFDRSISRLWKADSDNIFLVKFTYYWNM